MFCEKCGTEISNSAAFCPNCGAMIGSDGLGVPSAEPDNYSINRFASGNSNDTWASQMQTAGMEANFEDEERSGYSSLSIAAFILSLIGCTGLVGFILAIVDLVQSKKDRKKHLFTYIALGVCVLYILIGVIYGISTARKVEKAADAVSHALSPERSDENENDTYSTHDDLSNSESSYESDDRDQGDISPEFKAEIDAIEEFYDDYCDFMERYASAAASGDVMGMLADYTQFMSNYATYSSKLDNLNNNQNEMTQAELNYFLDAYNRIMKRFASVAYTVQ